MGGGGGGGSLLKRRDNLLMLAGRIALDAACVRPHQVVFQRSWKIAWDGIKREKQPVDLENLAWPSGKTNLERRGKI